MANRNYIDVLIDMVNAAKYQSDAEKAAKATKGIGTSAKETGKTLGSTLGMLAKWAAGSLAIGTASRYLHGAISESVNLGRQSLQLNRITGLSVKQGSEWIVTAQQWGIEGNRLGQMFTQLGRAQQRAETGSKQQLLAFKQLGISMSDLRSMDTTQLVESISTSFSQMPNSLQKAALAQQLFGRTGRQLLPILNQGGDALQGQLEMVDKYGAALEGKTAADIQKMIVRQRELNIAQLGMKEQLADALIPTLTALSGVLAGFLKIAAPVLRNQILLRGVLIGLVAAYLVYTIATIHATLATIGFRTVLITTGIGALLVGIGIAILLVATHFDQLKAAGERLFGWVKSHWRLLAVAIAGPFGLMAIAIVKAVQLIKRHIREIAAPVDWIVGKVQGITGAVGGIASHVPGFAMGTLAAPGGMALVGERGPELVYLPPKTRVDPLTGPAARGGTPNVHVTVEASDVLMDGQKVGRVQWKAAADYGARR